MFNQQTRAQFSVGSVEGVPFTACTSGPDIIILASNFSRVQQITATSPISSLDCSTDVGKIAAAYDNKMVIFEPIPLVQQQNSNNNNNNNNNNNINPQEQETKQSTPSPQTQPPPPTATTLQSSLINPGGGGTGTAASKLDYKWVQTATLETGSPISVMSFNSEGNKLIAGGVELQLWTIQEANKTDWQCIWNCRTASNISHLKFSPDGTLFCSASDTDKLVKIWYKHKNDFSFIYIAHPLPVTSLEWRRTSKYTPQGAVANMLITSCKDNIARIWIHNIQNFDNCIIKPSAHFYLAAIIEIENNDEEFITHWINNKQIHITRSVEQLLHDMLLKILKGNNNNSNSEPQSESCSDSKNDTDDDTITAEQGKKLRHKLCRKINKQRALAAAGRDKTGRNSPATLVEEFDKTLETLLKKWQKSTDLVFSINHDGVLTLWQVKYLDGEDSGVYRQVEVERICRLEYALPYYDATTMSLDVIAYSPSAYLEVKKAYMAVTNSTSQVHPIDVSDILSIKTQSSTSLVEIKETSSGCSIPDAEPSIFIVTQHLSGILGLWKFNFDAIYPKVQSVDLVTRITGLPIDPKWLRDGILTVEYSEADSAVYTRWLADENGRKLIRRRSTNDFMRDSYRISEIANEFNILPQYHLKQLIELLAFGKLQRVKAILNYLVNTLVLLEASPWPHRSRTLSIVGGSASFHESFDIDNPLSTIEQQVVEEIELDYVEVTAVKPLPLYSILESDKEDTSPPDNKCKEEFSTDYESILRIRPQVDETLDEILGKTTTETLKKQNELKRIASETNNKSSLTSFNPKKAKLLTRVLTHTHLPGLSNVDQMHLLAVADAVALFDASPEDYNDMHDEEEEGSGGLSMISTNIAIDSLDDRGLRFLTAMRQHVYLTRCLPMNQRNELKAIGIGNHNVVWAFHSESQDELISLIPCVQRNKPEWSELREFGIGWWVKKLEVLRKLIEKVAQSAFQAKQDPLDAALFYLAMKKKTLVCALLRRVKCDNRLLKLFEQDFSDPVNRKKALKNAYALLGLHRFEHAAAFFILAGSIWDAVEVCINNLNDIQLAIVLIRLHDNDTNLPDKKLLSTEILDLKRVHPDPFLRSMAYWKIGDYLSAVHTLLETDIGQQPVPPAQQAVIPSSRRSSMSQHGARRNSESSQLTDTSSPVTIQGGNVSASVFNFYLFLKDQPLVTKQKQQVEDKYSDEAITEKERVLFFSTANAYLEAGCPLLALEVLCSKDHLNMSKAQRMKFIACLNILMNELNTLATSTNNQQQSQHHHHHHHHQKQQHHLKQIGVSTTSSVTNTSNSNDSAKDLKFGDVFYEWLEKSVEALKVICSYNGIKGCTNNNGDKMENINDNSNNNCDDLKKDKNDNLFISANEPILRAMLCYCNMNSAKVNCLTTVRLELLNLLN